MNTSRIYVEAAGGVRLYTVAGTTDRIALTIETAKDGDDRLTQFNAILVDPEGTPEEPKVVTRNLYVDTSMIVLIEQGEVYDSQFVSDHTARERFDGIAEVPPLQSV